MTMNDLESMNITLQTKDVNAQIVKNSLFKPSENITIYKSYDWLYSRLGYYPIFGMTITEYLLTKEWDKVYDYIIPGLTKDYCYILDSEKEYLETDFYKWMDIHYLINDGSEEENEAEKDKLNIEYITKLKNHNFIQLLFKDIHKTDILSWIKYK